MFLRISHWFFLLALMMSTACVTVGKDFDHQLADTIVNGKTTQAEVKNLLGKPFKTGIQNGNEIWIYEMNTYQAVGQNTSKDFIVVFDEQGVVKSHQSMNSQPE